ncbi:MAG: pyridoxal phosphate-dependent aminotransferase, partial [Planctomycetaceae bacterium]|nr:pyridoxal phosphate-dependent aminotransferase [Planctomycetaceae bacterium]
MEVHTVSAFDFDREIDRYGTGSIKYGFHETYGKPQDVIPLWVADMDFQSPPEVHEALTRYAKDGVFGYTYALPEYHEAVGGWMERRFGWCPDPEWDQTIPGVMFGVAAAIRALTKEGETVLIQQPVYPPFQEIIASNRRKLAVNELVLKDGRYEIDFEAFERQIIRENVRVFLLCSPHNPVARIWTEAELRRMGELCLKYGVRIISDEIHADFALFGNRQILFPTLGEELARNCVLCTSPSKTFNLMGLQTANMWIPDPEIRAAVVKECQRSFWFGINAMALTASAAAYRHGEEWLDALCVYLEENVRLVTRRLAEMNSGIQPVTHDGTYLMWLDCRSLGMSSGKLDAFFTEKAKLWLYPGVLFGAGGPGFFRMNIGAPHSVLARAMDQLEDAFRMGGPD